MVLPLSASQCPAGSSVPPTQARRFIYKSFVVAGQGKRTVPQAGFTGKNNERTETENMIGGSNKLLGIAAAAELLAVPERRLRDHYRRWGIRAYKVGRELRFRERDLWSWVESNAA
jgi:excisionase family DNA binding protein